MGVEAQITEALEAIKSAPNADSRELHLNPSLLQDLHAQGLIEANVYDRWGEGSMYSDMRVTLHGESYLERMAAASDETNGLVRDPPDRSPPAWYSNPFLKAIFATLSGLAVIGIAYYLGWS